MKHVPCDYCGQPARLVTGADLYPHRPDLAARNFWQCVPCDAYVGCHRGGDLMTPLGRLANMELRLAKNAAHRAFDPVWQTNLMKRQAAYLWLATCLGIPFEACHIGMFDVATCERVVTICAKGPT